MSPQTSKASYRKHQYSGSLKSRKRIRAALLAHYNDGETSREKLWRKKRKVETPPKVAVTSSGQNILKTYSRVPKVRVAANFGPQTDHDNKPLTSNSEAAVSAIMPVTDPDPLANKLTVKKEFDNTDEYDPLANELTIEKEFDNTLPDPLANELTVKKEFDNTDTDPLANELTVKKEFNNTDPNPLANELTVEKEFDNTDTDHSANELTVEQEFDDTDTDHSANELTIEKEFDNSNPDPIANELTVENEFGNNFGLYGNRVVDIQHVLNWAFSIGKHTETCTDSTILFDRELQRGFHSTFIFKCSSCKREFRESNERHNRINNGFVYGTFAEDTTYSQAAHLTNVMDIPTMGEHMFRQIEKSLTRPSI